MMIDNLLILSCSLIFILTLVISRFIIKKAHSIGLMDEPNDRSSHKTPTPRGGGISFVLTVSLFSIFYLLQTQNYFFLLYLFVPISMAALGFVDDFYNLSAKFKFKIQILVACLFSISLYFNNPDGSLLDIGVHLFYIPFILWLTNLYNFMDGIDGIAGSQALFSGIAFCLFLSPGTPGFYFGLFLGVSCAAFLIYNWHPAKIFMGDVGSCYLGSGLAILSIYLNETTPMTMISGAMLIGPFIVDATWTLIVRFSTGQAVMSAHRLHLYQKLANEHQYKAFTISAFYFFYSALLFLPISYFTQSMTWFFQIGFFTLASLPLIFLSIYFKSGRVIENQ